MSSNPRIVPCLIASTAVAIFGLLDTDGLGGFTVLAWTIGSAALIIRQSRMPRPPGPSILPLLAWVASLLAGGVLIRAVHGVVTDQSFPFPSPADALHFPAYMLTIVLLWRLYRARSVARNVDAWLDGIALAHALIIVSWVAFYGDFVADDSIPSTTRLANAPFDIIIAASAVLVLRISATPGERPYAYRLLAWAFVAFGLVDLAAALTLARGTGLSLTVALSPYAATLAVLASRHQSVHELLRPQARAETHFTKLRLGLISFSIVAPVLVLLGAGDLTGVDKVVVTSLIVSLSCIMTARAVRIVNDQQRTIELERLLGHEVSRIAQLDPSPDALRTAIATSARKLLPPRAVVSIEGHEPHTADAWFAEVSIDSSTTSKRDYLTVRNYQPCPRDERILKTLNVDVETIARASHTKLLTARAESEADAARQIAANERRFRALVQNASDLVMVFEETGKLTYMSESSERILGYPPEDFLDRTASWAILDDDVPAAESHFASVVRGTEESKAIELRLIHKEGDFRLLECTFTDLRSVEGVDGIVVNATDVTEMRTLKQDLLNAETTDPLTLLLNRNAFTKEVSTAMRRSSLAHGQVAVAILNLNNFREINKGLGPVLGDQLLISTAQSIRRSVRLTDTVARLSGDEFAILMPNVLSETEAVASIERVVGEIASPVLAGDREFRLQASAGLAIDQDFSADGAALLRKADTALDAARSEPHLHIATYEDEMGQAASERVEIRSQLKHAINNGELRLVYQPIIDMGTGAVVSFEALSRWEHPQRGPISPGVFIPIAESTGLIGDLGEWALETACAQLVEWDSHGIHDISVSVNMSGEQLRSGDVIARIGAILTRTNAPADRITIEITESVLIDDTDFIADRINALRTMGLGLAIDDFGTGYSSLSYLQRYEFDVLKIDRSFVRDIDEGRNQRRSEIVRSIVSLARGLGAVTVAEGVEEDKERRQLDRLGCDRAQGFLFYRPLELAEANRMLHAEYSNQLTA